MGRSTLWGHKTLWVCGRVRGYVKNCTAWELQGIFDTEEAAIAACVTANDFIGPVPLNFRLPQEWTEWPDVVFPLYGGEKS